MKGRATLLVTGANGALGRRVVERLLSDGRHHVVAGSRDPKSLDDLAALGAETRRVDFDDTHSLPGAFAGVDRLLIISTDSAFEPGRRLAQHLGAVAGAVKAKVQHVTYTSMPNPEPPPLIFYAPDHYGTEQSLKSSGVDWTILRNGWYSEITFPLLQNALQTRRWVTVAGDGRVPYVARDDCAAAAAAVLANGSGRNSTFNLTGPDALSVHDLAAEASAVFDVPITVAQVTAKEKADYLPSCGITPAFVPVVILSDINTQLGRGGAVTRDVETLTGRAPLSFREVLIANRDGARSVRILGKGTIFGPEK